MIYLNFIHKKIYRKRIKNQINIGIQTEQIYNEFELGFSRGWLNKYKLARKMRKVDLIFNWSPTLSKKYSLKNKKYHFSPYGFTSKTNHDNLATKKYDIIFIGNTLGIDLRRKKIIELLKEKYHFYPKHGQLWGKEKIQAISESKICLNLHYDYSSSFESPRFFEYIENGGFVLSEHVFDSFPFKAHEDYVPTNLNEIFEKVDFYLVNPDERQKIIDNSKNKLKFYTMENSFSKIISTVDYYNYNKKSKIVAIFIYLFIRIKRIISID